MTNKMKKYREKMGLTQKQMADKMGIAVSSYNMFENGKRKISVITAKKISIILKESIDKIFFEDFVHN